jgi:hypothetical protein
LDFFEWPFCFLKVIADRITDFLMSRRLHRSNRRWSLPVLAALSLVAPVLVVVAFRRGHFPQRSLSVAAIFQRLGLWFFTGGPFWTLSACSPQ